MIKKDLSSSDVRTRILITMYHTEVFQVYLSLKENYPCLAKDMRALLKFVVCEHGSHLPTTL